MKRLFSIFAVALLSLAIVSCSKEESMPETGGSADVLTFTFEGLNYGPISYAIATTPENTVNELDIYMFESASGAFLKKWEWQDGVANAEATITTVNLTQTLKLTGAEGFGVTDKVFYFVANPGSTTTLSTSSESAFKEQLTDELSYGTDGYKSPVTPLLFTGKTGAINPISGTTSTVQMRRRVARFDIVNEYENLTIEKVFISGANLYGYAFGNATGVNASGITADKYEVLAGPTAYESINSERIAQSVFYLYPTTVNAYGANKKTEIAMQVKQAGATASEIVYVTAENYSVLANYRYKLVISESVGDNSYKLNLVYEDWIDGGSTEVDREDTGVTISNAELNSAVWTVADYDFFDNNGGTITFTVTSSTGTTPVINYTRGNASDLSQVPVMTKTSSVITYGTAKTTETYEVTIPEYATQTDWMDIEMTLVNNANPENNASFLFYTSQLEITSSVFPGTGLLAFANTVADVSGDGYLTRTETEAVTKIMSGTTTNSIKNDATLKGLEVFYALEEFTVYALQATYTIELDKFPALTNFRPYSSKNLMVVWGVSDVLKYIDVDGCRATSYVDVSGYPNLETLDCRDMGITFLNLDNPKLEYLYAENNNIATLDLSKCPALEEVQFYSGNAVSINLTGLSNLQYLEIYDNKLSTIDLSDCVSLHTLYLNENRLTTLDVTGCASLESLYANGNRLTSFISANPLLTELEIHDNYLTSIDLSQNPELHNLYIQNNYLTELDLSVNDELRYIYAAGNPISGNVYVTTAVFDWIGLWPGSFTLPSTATWAVQ